MGDLRLAGLRAVQWRQLGLSTRDGPVYIVVQEGDTAADIGERLEAAEIIDSGSSFQRLAIITGAESRLSPASTSSSRPQASSTP